MHGGAAPEGDAVKIALEEWRRKATDALLIASIISYFPGVILMLGGEAPPSTGLVQGTMAGAYVVVILSTMLRRIDFRVRAGAMLVVAYIMIFVGNMTFPQGPFLRALPVFLPLLTLVLFGVPAGRYATVFSAVILLCVPFLHDAPFIRGVIVMPANAAPVPLTVMLTQSAGLMGVLIALMILLERFYWFLLQSLSKLEKEASDRRAAYQDLEWEMSERKRLEREVARAGDEERRRLGHEIHDGVCQQLTGALLRSEALTRRLNRGETPVVEELSALSSLLDETIEEARAVAQGLCPLDADPEALAEALKILIKRTRDASGLACQFETAGDVSVADSTTAHHLYRIAQEAVSNAVRHAHASRITVALRGSKDGLILEVEDNGEGLPGKTSEGGMGLRTMAYRARFLEGEFTMAPLPKGGTRIFCRVPGRGFAPYDE